MRTILGRFKETDTRQGRGGAGASFQVKSTTKITFLERQRYLEAMKQQMAQKFKDLGLQVPRICSCGNATDPLDPMYTFYCANNCPLFRNQDQQQYLLRTFLSLYDGSNKTKGADQCEPC